MQPNRHISFDTMRPGRTMAARRIGHQDRQPKCVTARTETQFVTLFTIKTITGVDIRVSPHPEAKIVRRAGGIMKHNIVAAIQILGRWIKVREAFCGFPEQWIMWKDINGKENLKKYDGPITLWKVEAAPALSAKTHPTPHCDTVCCYPAGSVVIGIESQGRWLKVVDAYQEEYPSEWILIQKKDGTQLATQFSHAMPDQTSPTQNLTMDSIRHDFPTHHASLGTKQRAPWRAEVERKIRERYAPPPPEPSPPVSSEQSAPALGVNAVSGTFNDGSGTIDFQPRNLADEDFSTEF